jgi:hypothetical protein
MQLLFSIAASSKAALSPQKFWKQDLQSYDVYML